MSKTIGFNVKFATMYKLQSGEKKRFERDISDHDVARKLFETGGHGEYLCKPSLQKEMGDLLGLTSISRDGDFPFILKHYDKIKFTDWYGGELIADIDSTQIYRHGRYWRILYKVSNVIKIK